MRSLFLILLLCLGCGLRPGVALAVVQPGAVLPGFDPGSVIDGPVLAVATQRNGRLVIGGSFRSVRGAACRGLARLLPNGQVDRGFRTGYGFSRSNGSPAEVRAVAVQRDGKIVAGGVFSAYGGISVSNICRLNADGSLDDSFDPGGLGANGPVNALLLLSNDLKLIVAGDFTEFLGQPRLRIAAVSDSAGLETGFGEGLGFDGPVHALAAEVSPFNRLTVGVWAGGAFSDYRGVARARVARLTLLGAVSAGFDPGAGPNGTVRALAVQPDGSAIIGGNFTSYRAVSRSRVARLLPDGDLDEAFTPPEGTDDAVRALVLERQTVLVGGDFTNLAGFAGLARLRLDSGAVDFAFGAATGTGGQGEVRALTRQANGRVLVAGTFQKWDGVLSPRLARIQSSGRRDASLRVIDGPDGMVNCVARQNDGRVLVGGAFESVSGQPRRGLARLLANGRLDSRFKVGAGFAGGVVNAVEVLADEKILVAGSFTSCDGTPAGGLARLLPDGRRDPEFNPGGAGVAGGSGSIFCLKVLLNGNILIAGNFTSCNGVARGSIARLTSTGALDAAFTTAGGGADGVVYALSPEPNGSVVIGGAFTTYNGVARARLAKLQANGDLDAAFLPVPANAGPNLQVQALQRLTNGDLLVGGFFTEYNGQPVSKLIRVNADGSHPPAIFFEAPAFTFQGSPLFAAVLDVAVQPDGRVLVGGLFDEAGGYRVANVMRLEADGAPDEVFFTRQETSGLVSDLLLEPDGNVLVAGSFSSIDRQPRGGVARLAGGFAFARQSFGGVVKRSALNEQLGARFSLTLTASGQCSGVIAGTRRLAFRGRFDARDGTVAIPLRGSGGAELLLSLSLNFLDDDQVVTLSGELSETAGPASAELTAHLPFGRVPQAEAEVLAGLYTGWMEPDGAAATPRGYGIWNLRMPHSGVGRLTGRAADGSALTMSGPMSAAGEIALHQLLYRRRGCLRLELRRLDVGVGGRKVLRGTQEWLKRIGASPNFYEDGFLAAANVVGTAWTPPRAILLDLSFAPPNALFTAGLGNLPYFESLIHIDGRNRVTDPGTIENLKFRFNRRTGIITGSFRNPLLPRPAPLPYRMILVNGAPAAVGHLILRDPATGLVRSSLVAISEPPP